MISERSDELNNAALSSLLRAAALEESDHRRRALERAARSAWFWPEEAAALGAAGRPLTELRAVGPWVEARIKTWLDDPPSVPDDPLRAGFLTMADVGRALPAGDPWRAAAVGDLQVHTTDSDGSLDLESMVDPARLCGRTSSPSRITRCP